jgi:hypothetical protein
MSKTSYWGKEKRAPESKMKKASASAPDFFKERRVRSCARR